MRLIDADALMASYAVAYSTTNNRWHIYVNIETINSAPTVDAVEVVRCKECKWYKSEMIPATVKCLIYCKPIDYCSYGERRY